MTGSIDELKTKAAKLAEFLERSAEAHGDESKLSSDEVDGLISGLLDLRLRVERLTDRVGTSEGPGDSATEMLAAAREFVNGAFDKLKDLPDVASADGGSARDQPYFLRHEPGPLVALEIRARQSANGQAVLRPASYQRSRGDQWDVDFDIRALPERNAAEMYASVRSIRRGLLREEEWYERYYRTSFMAHIEWLSERGRSWREALDRLDHERERVVFEPHER